MKTRLSRKAKKLASALLTTLIICSILSMSVMYYLSLIDQQNSLNARSQTWNLALSVSEAGVEDGLQHLNSNGSNLGVDGWSCTSSGVYQHSNTLPDGSSYTAYVFVTNAAQPIVVAQSFVPTVKTYAMGGASSFFAALGLVATTGNSTTATTPISRKVQVTCTKSACFNAALIVKHGIDLKGNGVYTDSYNSTVLGKNKNGKYDLATYSGDCGDIATIGGITDSVGVQNANIYGTVHTGPNCPVSIGSQGGVGPHGKQVGDIPTAIKNGYVVQDANFTFPDTAMPSGYGSWLTPLPGTRNGTNYDYVLLTGGKYILPTTANKKIWVDGADVTLALPNGLQGTEYLNFASGANLVAYCDKSVSLNGNNVFNPDGTAGSLIVLCTPNVTSFTLTGNGAFTGVLVAPYTDVALKGSGNSQQDFCGTLMANSIGMNGHFSFHYDESLKNSKFAGRFIIKGWIELKPS